MNLHTSQIAFILGLFVYLAIRLAFQRRNAGVATAAMRATPGDRGLVLLVVAGQVLLPGVYVFSRWLNFANHEAPPSVALLGAVMWLAGLWLFWRSHADLGRNWSVTLEVRTNHQLITEGVYRYVRHPMYAAFLLLGLAQALLLPNYVAGLSALATVTLMCWVRMPREEAMMCEFFGEDYRRYMRRTGRVFPRAGRHALV